MAGLPPPAERSWRKSWKRTVINLSDGRPKKRPSILRNKMKTNLPSKPYRFGFSYPEEHSFKAQKGLSSRLVEEISAIKGEPAWMRHFRLRSLGIFEKKPLPGWGADLSRIKFDDLYYYLRPTGKQAKSWKQVPDSIRKTYERIGVPQAERKYLAGLKAQYDSEVIYGTLREDLEKLGVIFLGMDEALSKHPDLVR